MKQLWKKNSIFCLVESGNPILSRFSTVKGDFSDFSGPKQQQILEAPKTFSKYTL